MKTGTHLLKFRGLMSSFILAIDQGTTSTRAILFNEEAKLVHYHHVEITQYFPQGGWVEHDPEEIWDSTLLCCCNVLEEASLRAADIAALGISNQRETTILWDRHTGQPLYRAIGWQDRRTVNFCEQLASQAGVLAKFVEKTGLILDPYFSCSKIKWILDNIKGAYEKAKRGELAFGTVDSYLLWKFTGGKCHATDATNASRTGLFNINQQRWDDELLTLFDIPKSLLPTVLDNCAQFGFTDLDLLGHKIPITAMIGDQQAAAVGQACIKPGMVKSTYGTGCFMLLNTGDQIIHSRNRLLATIAYRLNDTVTYGLEGSIFIAGAAVKWLRDPLHLIEKANDSESMASSVEDTGGVYLVPAFTGLGAPYWDPNARGALFGLTRNTQREHIVRAALEAVCYQSKDLVRAILNDGANLTTLRVDGGMAANNWLLQFLSDILGVNVDRSRCIESSALGTAFLAGLGAGLFDSLEEMTGLWQADRHFIPQMDPKKREELYDGWQKAVEKTLTPAAPLLFP
ncbi:glycerol kinase GlpK [Coxiella burnetii]|uniref:glycerol kinase GlpK n=1 Tax=Coxiella burnetii TaxID=777 RepID=UPI000CCBFF0C|nr:glycerol kinase GlpK [Coxiella burnetii]PNT90059.1 glycerol kinase [Coxiella burnetii]